MSTAKPSTVTVRAFARSDRDQVTSLVNAHVGAVIPGISVSVSGLMSQLEHEPGEFIVDPWVIERVTLVAEQHHRVVAAAHLLRYADDPEVGDTYRGAGEIRWLVHWPEAPYWPEVASTVDALAQACLARLSRWGVSRCHADGALPAPGIYGVPEQWPHIRELYRRHGFRKGNGAGHDETVLLARVSDLARMSDPACAGDPAAGPALTELVPRRTLGINGTRISAVLDGRVVGLIELGDLDQSPRTIGTRGWADIGNLDVPSEPAGGPVAQWLLAQAADWLDLGHFTRVLAYLDDTDADREQLFLAAGFRVLTRTARGLTLP